MDRLQGDWAAQVSHSADSVISTLEVAAIMLGGGVLTQGGKQIVKEGVDQATDVAARANRGTTYADELSSGLPAGYRELPAAGAAANPVAGLPDGYRRVADADADGYIAVIGPRGGVYHGTDYIDSAGNMLYMNNGKLYALESGQRTYIPASQRVAGESVLVRGGGASNRLATGPDEAMFWSGVGRSGDTVAANAAAQQGRVTLETTLAARGVNLPAWDPTSPTSVAAWRQASHDFAAGASGHVRVLQGDAVRIDSVWAQVEFPALKANPNVKSITTVDAKTGAEVLLWSR